jgi:uncharacterized SAM-binding protein YcdF (DUF218 family)
MYNLIVHLLQPYTFAFLITGLAIVSLWRTHHASRGRLILLTIGFALMSVLNLPVVSYLALGSLEWQFPPLNELPDDAGAIVVLSGSSDPPDSVRIEATLGCDTYVRCIYAAEVYHRGGSRPLLISGGKPDGGSLGPSGAELMRDFLVKLGVDSSDSKIESNSRSTYENAVECRKLLDQLGIRKILLVTEATHMRRAALCFRKQGIEVVPAACHHRATDFEFSILNFLPSSTAADGLSDPIHEWLGLAWYRLRGML